MPGHPTYLDNSKTRAYCIGVGQFRILEGGKV